MEQRKNWMWRRNLKPKVVDSLQLLSHEIAWEEKAFAEDSAGLLGGCIWPPKSYSCSFCWREFRSAQALGGHMNSHRRDRARLKQLSSVKEGISAADDHGPVVTSRSNYVVALPSDHQSLIRVSEVSSTAAAATHSFISPSLQNGPTTSTASFVDSSLRKRDMKEDEESFRMKRWRLEEENFKLLAPSPVEELDLELRLGQHSTAQINL